MNSSPPRRPGPGTFCISLDFELMWGGKGTWKDRYRRNVIGGRAAMPRMLDMFAAAGVHATWATVGILFAESLDELHAFLPPESEQPRYRIAALSAYRHLNGLGSGEASDPLHFGGSLIRLVAACPGQEIGTHTFSHFYALEEGSTIAAFNADLDAATRMARAKGIELRSIVFPRNQYSPAHIDACRAHGLTAFRGNPDSLFYRPLSTQEARGPVLRLGRIADTYFPLSRADGASAERGICNVPASVFLRPYRRRLASLEGLRLHRITSAMRRAAKSGGLFHLWWHPENFGLDIDENIAFLGHILDAYRELNDALGFRSLNMGEIAAETLATGG